MAENPQSEIHIRDGETDVRDPSADGTVQDVRIHYICRAETGVFTGLLFGERVIDRVQGTFDQQGSVEVSGGNEVQPGNSVGLHVRDQ